MLQQMDYMDKTYSKITPVRHPKGEKWARSCTWACAPM